VTTTKRASTWWWVGGLIAGVLLVVLAFCLDGAVHHWQQAHRLKNIQVLSRNVTRGTDWPVHVVLGCALCAIAWWRRSERWAPIFLAMILAGALSGISAYGLKVTTGRVRPSVKVEQVWRGPDNRQNYQSFPSGHTAFSAGFFALLLFVSWRIGLLCFLIPIFVGFTRIFLGAHYFSDVIAAMLLGILSAAIVAQFVLPRMKIPARAP
jgi:undecaprenyl-diphosphatase